MQDIIAAETEKKNAHFIGSIVYIQEGIYTAGEVREWVVIDGQQRLTTLSLLYAALYRFARETGRTQDAERLYHIFLTNQYAKANSQKVKLRQTGISMQAYQALLTGNEKQFENQYSNVIDNYFYFKNFITEALFDTICNGLGRLIFVEISLERDRDDPQRIFESLNSTGLELSQSDLIRNYILMDLEPRRQQEVYEHFWRPVEENTWDDNRKKSMLSDFIRDYLTLRNHMIPNKGKVYEAFKKLRTRRSEADFDEELEKIKSLSIHYRKFINPGLVSDKEIQKELSYLNRLEVNVAYPFLLQVFEDAENGLLDRGELISVLKLVQTYAWRRFVTGYPTSSLNKVFMTLYAEVDVEEYHLSVARALLRKKASSKFPNDDEVETALESRDFYNIQPKNRSYLFEMLENYQNREWVDTSIAHITVEHIFPQTPGDIWRKEIGDEDFKIFSEKYLHTLGNLTLSGNNGALGNRTFSEKKAMNVGNGEQGYLYSRLWLNHDLKNLDRWDVDAYATRSARIRQRFFSIWPYPDVKIEQDEATEEQTLFEAESPTFQKLSYFVFLGERVEEKEIAKLYSHVISKLYEQNANLLINNQESLKIGKSQSEFRSPLAIGNGWFVESNLNNEMKMAMLKRLLTLFELEDDLLIRYEDPAIKHQPSRYARRRGFWKQLLPQITTTELYRNISPSKDYWLSAGAGFGGINYAFVVGKNYARIELVFLSASKEKNKCAFNQIRQSKHEIEKLYGESLVWEELPDKKMSRIKIQIDGIGLARNEDWTFNDR